MELVLGFDFDKAGDEAKVRAFNLIMEFNSDPWNFITYKHPNPNATEQEQADYDLDLWEMRRAWKSSFKRRTEVEWLAVFPQAKSKHGKMIRSTLNLKLKRLNDEIQWINFKARALLNKKLFPKVEQNLYDEAVKHFSRDAIKDLEQEIKRTKEQLKLLSRIGNKKFEEEAAKKGVTDIMIQKAKEYPLEKLVEINRQKFTKCFRHKDKTPSAYCKGNFLHCFVCNASWDTIAILMERDGMKFKEAVLKLQ